MYDAGPSVASQCEKPTCGGLNKRRKGPNIASARRTSRTVSYMYVRRIIYVRTPSVLDTT
jgi:hypothetical protein